MADIRLAKPAAGTTQTVPSAPDGRFIFDFPADAATLTRSGDNLVLTFEDGASIQLQDFYTTYSKEEMPSFQVEGVEISGQDFFAALGEDLMPAAGPAAGSSASRSGRYNEYGGSDLLDGLDHLGRLDIGFDGGVQLATDTVEPSPYYEDDHGVTVTPSAPGTDPDDPDIPVQGEDFPPTMPHDVLQVDESALEGGRGGGSATADGSMSVSASDGVATITIGGVVVWQDGALTGNPVQTDEGHLDVTGFDGTNLTYTYTLDKATQEHGKEGGGENDAIAHEMEVVVTDRDGDSGSAVIRVEITDDVPTIESFGHDVTEGSSTAINGDALAGSAAGADGADFAWTNPAQQGQYGTITLNEDGTYSYTLDNDNEAVKELSKDETLTEEFTYTYKDADGDVATGSVLITINGVDNGVVVTPSDPEAGSETLTVYESGLEDGSQAGQSAAPTTASGSLDIDAPDGVASIKIGNVTVFENGALTSNRVPTDEGVLTVTGFDAATGKLSFTYTLNDNTTEHNTDATDTQVSHDLAVTVTDMDGTTAGSTITVTIVDDEPTIKSFEHDVTEGATEAVTGNALDGAVAGADADATFAWGANQSGKYGEITLNPDGTYSYTLDNDNAAVKELSKGETLTEKFTYTYTDADGDIATGSVTITINGVDNGIVIEPTYPSAGSDEVTVYESGLTGGSQAGHDDAPITASGSLIIMAPDGVDSIVIGGVTVFEKGALTKNTVSTGEGVLAVTGFDPVTGELKFAYELTSSTTEHRGSGMDEISHDLTVTVTDTDGTEANSTITVNVVDDAPEITVNSDPSNTLGWTGGASGHYTTESGSLKLETGADGLKEGSLKVTDGAGKSATFDAEGSAIISYEDGSKLEAEYNAETGEISYTYTPGAGTETTDRSFTFSAQDNDDDPTSATVNVKVDLADSGDVPVTDQSIEVDESGLADGTTPDSGMITKPITLPEGYTLNTDGWSDGGDGALTYSVNGGKGLLTYKDGELTYTLQGNYAHADATNPNEGLSDKPTFDLNLTHDATGVEVSTTVTVDVLDDAPTISSVDADNDGKPNITFERYPDVDSEDTPLGDGAKADFTQYGTVKDPSGKERAEEYEDSPIWNSNVTITGGRVQYTYEGVVGEKDPRKVTGVTIIDSNKDLAYSEHIVNPNVADKEQNVGLTVSGKEEISADRSYNENGNFTGVATESDAIIVTLPEGAVAYGLNLKLGAFFTQSSSTGGSQWDTVPEQALLTFYKDGEVVLMYPVTANSADGSYTVPADLVITEGFDKVVISAVDNSWASKNNFDVEQSDFVVQEIGFVTLPPNEVMFRYEGDLVSDGGADGFADGYTFAFSDKMGESMNVTLGDGETVEATLTITEGDNGSSILLATVPGADGKTENLFSVTLDADGHWKFDQYQEFSMPDGSDFELGFMTKDNDGDKAYEEVTLITTTETNLGTSGDHVSTSNADVIVNGNSGHDNFVGDPGGATESTQTTYTDLNVALVVDTSGSMAGTRMSETKEALEGLCEQLKEHADKGADVNLSLIGFSGALNINMAVEDITGTEENYRKFTLHDGDTIIGKVGTEFSVTSYYSNGRISGTTTYRITEDGTLQRREWAFFEEYTWKDVLTSSPERLTGYEAVLAQIDDMEAIGGTVYSDGYEAAKDWFGDGSKSDSLQNNGGKNIVIFVTDGEPDSESSAQNAYNQLVAAVDNITVETVGIAITDKDATSLLNGLTTNNKGAHFIADASTLGNVFGEIVSDITTSTVTPAADDIILGGRGNDMLFGDALNADYLLEYDWAGKDTFAKGSSWDIINAYLVATLGHNPSEGEIAKFIAQNADKLGLTDTVADSAGVVRGGDDIILGGSGDDIIYGQGGDDLLFGDGSDTATDTTSIETLNTLDMLLTKAGAEISGSYADRVQALGTETSSGQPSELDRFIDSLEGTGGIEKDTDGNDQLFGGAGNDMIFGGAGDDFIDGGEGRDTIFGGSGNDIIVYDSNDYLVSGGSGIDFMVSGDESLTLDDLLEGKGTDKPIVDGIEVLLKGKDALSLTSLDQLAKDYGITLGTNAEGKETLILDMDKWAKMADGTYAFNGGAEDGDLTLETNLTPVDASDPASEAVQQQVFTLEHGNG